MLQVSYFKYTKRKYGEGRRILLMSPLHHHYQKQGFFETKIVTRFWIVSLLLAAITLVTLKTDNPMKKNSCPGRRHQRLPRLRDPRQEERIRRFPLRQGADRRPLQSQTGPVAGPLRGGHHSEERILAADEVVKSPGIPGQGAADRQTP